MTPLQQSAGVEKNAGIEKTNQAAGMEKRQDQPAFSTPQSVNSTRYPVAMSLNSVNKKINLISALW